MTGLEARRAAYVILSHRHPEQVARLATAINRLSPSAGILVLHDARRSAPPVIDLPSVRVVAHRAPADWGSWELVEATIRALDLAVRQFDPAMLILVSGQDHPARNLAAWEQQFLERGGGWIGEARALRYQPRWGRAYGVGDDDVTRYAYRWFPMPGSRALANPGSAAAAAARTILLKVGHYAEPVLSVRNVARGRGLHVGFRAASGAFASDMRCYKGSQWLALERGHWEEILRRHLHDADLAAAYRHSIIPDESYFQTILMSLGPPQEGPPVTYVDWRVEEDAPKTLELEDLPMIVASGAPFCRKIGPGVSDVLVERLDSLAPDR